MVLVDNIINRFLAYYGIKSKENLIGVTFLAHRAEHCPKPRPAVVNADGLQEKRNSKTKKDANSICGDVCVSHL